MKPPTLTLTADGERITIATMTATRPVTIVRPGLKDLRALRRLFIEALASDFYYFSPAYITTISRQNSLLHMSMSRLRRRRVVLVAMADNKLVGYVIGHVPSSRHGQLSWLYVEPSYRKSGLGNRLLTEALRQLRRNGATSVILATHNFAPYYQKRGFNELRVEESHGLPMHIMEYDLAKNSL
jgi:N-acetylglutamate synthase-like GNAT family acetyltransferase